MLRKLQQMLLAQKQKAAREVEALREPARTRELQCRWEKMRALCDVDMEEPPAM